MKYLIDTHILIWIAISPEKISKPILDILENADNPIYVSTVSFLEIAIKISIGKLNLQGLDIADLITLCEEQNIEIIQLPTNAITQYSYLTLKQNHKDPFDRALISICLSEELTFLSVDKKLDLYVADGLTFVS